MSGTTIETTATAAADEDAEEKKDNKDYSQQVRAIADKGIYEFEYVDGPKAGDRVRLPRQKISNKKMLELEKDRAEYASVIVGFRNGKVTSEQRHAAADMLSNIYAKLAEYYFHIPKDDFDNMDWDSTKPNIDAASNISIRGRPNLV